MRRLGSFVVRRRRAVIVVWVVLLLVTATIGSSAFSVLSTDFGAGTTTESGRVAQQLDDLAETGGQIAIVADGIDIDDPRSRPRSPTGLAPIAAARRRARRGRPLVHRRRRAAGHRRAGRPGRGDAGRRPATRTPSSRWPATVEDLAHELDAPEVLVGGNVLVSETFADGVREPTCCAAKRSPCPSPSS